jgi:hypothetical protein
LYGVVLVQVTLMLPDWLTADASTVCAEKATGLDETLQPALIVNETPRVVVAVPANAEPEANKPGPNKRSPASAHREVNLTLRGMCYHPKGSDTAQNWPSE